MAALILAGGLLLTTSGLAAPGDLDLTFGTGDGDGIAGVATWDSGNRSDGGYAVALQPDGRILVAGSADNGTDADLALARFNADGTLDTSFGTGDGTDGVATWDSGDFDSSSAVALQPDGRILVAGYADNGPDTDLALARFNADGTLDTSFGAGDGIAAWDGGSGRDEGYAMAVQPDGRVLVAGSMQTPSTGPIGSVFYDLVVARFTPDGALDPTFSADDSDGADGAFTWGGGANDIARSVVLQPNGKLLVAGGTFNGTNYDFALLRLTSDGALDTTFGTDGVTTWNSGYGDDRAHSVALQPDGKVLVAGEATNSSGDDDLALARFASDGALDNAFAAGDSDGMNGVALWDGESENDAGTAVALQPDGKVLVAGHTRLSGSSINQVLHDLVLIRFTAEGTRDSSFGSGGVVTLDSGSADRGYAVTIQPDGGVLVAGHTGSSSLSRLALARFDGGAWGTPPWDVEPNGFSLSGRSGVKPGSRVSSGEIFLTGLDPGVHVPVRTDTGGLSLLDGTGAQVHTDAAAVRAYNHYRFSVHHDAADTGGGRVTSRVTAGGVRPTPRSVLALGPTRSADFTSIANQSPGFTGGTGTVGIAEDAGTGALVTDLEASDPEGQSLAFAITGGNGDGRFAIDAATGEITVAEALDYETTTSYGLTVEVADGSGGSDSGTVTVNVTDVDEAPSLTGGTGTFSVAEDAAAGTVVTTLAATDPDGDTLSYAITGGNDAGKFAVDAGTGEITVAEALDYETTTSYGLTVEVADGSGGSDSGTVTVNVTDAAEGSGGSGGGGGCALDPNGSRHPGLPLLLALLGAAGLLRRGRI